MDLNGSYPYSRMLQEVLDKKSESWGVVWYWNLLKKKGLTLFPPASLVENIGWDGSGTHGDRNGFGSSPSGHCRAPEFPAWPKKIVSDHQLMSKLKSLFRRKLLG